MQNIWHQYLAIVVYSVFVCYLLFFLLWWQWKNSLCWYDDRISFVLSWWQGKAVFVVMMTGKTGSNIPVGPEPASALIRRSTTMLTCRARYSDIQNTTFTIFTLSDIFGGPVTQIFNYSIPYIYYRGLSLLRDFAELHTRVFLQRPFIFTNIIFAGASLMWKTVKDQNLATLQMMHEEMSLWKTMQFLLDSWRSWIGELMNFNL